jgi:Tfp pilus assembly protein PilX
MKKIVDTIANDRGSALVVALLVLVLLTLMGISATTTSTIEVRQREISRHGLLCRGKWLADVAELA